MQRRKFCGLNYSCGNEDYRVDTMLLPEHCQSLMSVANTGGQIIPFLAKHPKKLKLVDMSQEQLVIAELRFQTLRLLDYPDFLKFWDYLLLEEKSSANFRKNIISRVKISNNKRQELLINLMDSCNYESPLYFGKWDRTAIKLSGIYAKILGKNALKILSCKTMQDQNNFLKKEFPQARLKALIFFAATLATLYSALFSQEIPKRSESFIFYKEYQRIFSSLFANTLVRDNFFLQLILLGKISYQHALPLEAQENIYMSAKKWAPHCTVEFIHDDIISAASNSNRDINFLDLSNVNSYFEGDLKNNYLQRISKKLSKGCLIFTRNFLSNTDALNTSGFENISDKFINLFAQDYTQIYTMSLYKKL